MAISDDDLFSIDSTTGDLYVNEIDRDTLNMQIFTFLIFATEENDPWYSTNQTITFVVNDVNDHAPNVTDPDPKQIHFLLLEERVTQLNDTISVLDRDSVSICILFFFSFDEMTSNLHIYTYLRRI